jgi:small neutral amino acid transporter SnatA (MarC family)
MTISFGMMTSQNYPEIFKNYYLLIIPWPTFLAMFICALIYWYRIFILRPFRSGGFRISLLIQGLLFFVFSLLNVYWGIDELKKVYAGSFKVELLIVILVYYISTMLLYRFSPKAKNILDTFGIPVPKTLQLILMGICTLLPFWENGGWEMFKFSASWFLFLMTLDPLNRNVFSRASLVR